MDAAGSTNSKVLQRDQLLAIRDEARRAGRTLVHCHGCFDLVHPGHVRHLQHAARQGDLLLVTVTADERVGKGEGRPLIPQDLRAENLAALDCVDWVLVNPHATAMALLEEVRPDVYVKGREYESNDDPRFRAERRAVEEAGGRVVFSSGDVVFSSTALIGALRESAGGALASPAPAGPLGDARAEALLPALDRFLGRRVCIVGECLIDTYVHCDAPEVAGESPVLSLRPIERTSYDGGAAVIARHVAALGAHPTLVTGLPRSPGARALRDRLESEGIDVRAIEVDGPLLEKERFLVGAQKVIKVDHAGSITLDAQRQEALLGLARDASDSCDVAIIADFGTGLMTAALVARLARDLRNRVSFLAGDVSGRRASLLGMREMDLLTPTEAELRAAVGDYGDSINAVVWTLLETTGARRALVTMGADGMTAFERRDGAEDEAWANRLRVEHVPALALHPVDTLGCGDAALSVATLALASLERDEGALRIAARLAGLAAALEARALGNVPIAADDLRQGAAELLAPAPSITTRSPSVRMVV